MALESEKNRHFPRIKLSAPLHYQVRGKPEYDNVLIDNISLGGLAFTHSKYIPRMTPLMLEFNVLSRCLTPIGRIVWASPMSHTDKYHLGVEFLEMDVQQKNFLSDYIELQTTQL